MSMSRAERAKALEEWAERVVSSDLQGADTEALRTIAELAEPRDEVESELTEAVRSRPEMTHRVSPRLPTLHVARSTAAP